jgi:DNA-directed RNA polymerase subunit M/transcription elongation factor TFIIS
MAFNCLNPSCGKMIKLQRPTKSGAYKVTCPHCGVTKLIKLKGLDTISENPQQSQAIDNSNKPIIEIDEDFIVGNTYKIKCPHCNNMEFGFKTEKAGHRAIPCPSCKGKCGVDVRDKTQAVSISEQLQLMKGKLILLNKGWFNKDYHLLEGKNIVGRYDEIMNSDIAIKNDPTISRRSIEIEVKRHEKGYFFKLTVLKATNPVLHNNNPLLNGESVSLNFGDTIILGKTKFRFDKDI